MTHQTNPSLSAGRRRLVELLRRVHFGRVEGLRVRGGEPLFDPPPRLRRRYKFPGHNEPLSPPASPALKEHHLGLFALLDDLGDGTIDAISVQDGLPLSAEVSG